MAKMRSEKVHKVEVALTESNPNPDTEIRNASRIHRIFL